MAGEKEDLDWYWEVFEREVLIVGTNSDSKRTSGGIIPCDVTLEVLRLRFDLCNMVASTNKRVTRRKGDRRRVVSHREFKRESLH